MTLTFNDDPCLDSESNFRDDNVFKRSVIRLLCRIVPAATTVLGKIGLIDPAGADIDISNPLPVQGTVNISALPPVTVVLPPDSATSTLQLAGNNTLTVISAGLNAQTLVQANASNQVAANALLTTIDTSLNSIETATATQATAANQVSANALLSTIDTSLNSIETAIAIPPEGGATEDKQDEQIFRVRYSDTPIFGDEGPLQQHEKEQPNYPARELLTFDTNVHNLFGSQRLVSDDNKKLKVESFAPNDLRVEGVLALRALDEIMINLNGHGSVAFQISGTWTGTISFLATIDYVTWYAWSCQASLAVASVLAISTTGNGIWQARTAGLKAFKLQFTTATTGSPRVILNASLPTISYQQQVTSTPVINGSQTALLQQRNVTLEQTTSDSALREALYIAEPYNANVIYFPGDVVFWNGRNYRCILQTTITATVSSPASATYWTADYRPSRSLITNQYASGPDAPRLRIEHDLDAYQYRLQEDLLLSQQMQAMQYLINADYSLTVSQGQGGQYGKSFAMGQSSGSFYNFNEIR